MGKISESVYPTGFQIDFVQWRNSLQKISSVNPKFSSTKLQSFERYFFGNNYELMGKVRFLEKSQILTYINLIIIIINLIFTLNLTLFLAM